MEYTNKRKNSFEQDTQTPKHIRFINYSPPLNVPTDNYLLSSTTPIPSTHDHLKEVALLEDDTINLMDIENTNNNINKKRRIQIENETSNTENKKKPKYINYNNNQLLYNKENITNKIVINDLAKDDYFIDYLKIGTINIQRAYQQKKVDIINYFVTHNYDILGLTETAYQLPTDNKLLEIILHPYITNEKIFIIHDTNGNTCGSGVSIMMTQQIYQHNHYSSTFEGRICNVKLGFKGSKTLDITCCYLPARDFNCAPKEKTNINHQVITHLKSTNFTDLAKFHAQEKEPDITHKVNRIDYHFGNEELLKNSIHTFTQGIPISFFKTDHKAVITLLDRSFWMTPKYRNNRTDITHNTKSKKKELKYVYDDMTPELWANYKDQSRKIFTRTFKKFNCQEVYNLEQLNHMWNKIENCIIKTKKDNITQRPMGKDIYNQHPLSIRQLNNHVIFLYRTKQYFNLKHICLQNHIIINHSDTINNKLSIIPPSIWNSYFEKWPTYLKKILDIVEHIELTIDLTPVITKDNYIDQKKKIYSFYNTLKTMYQNVISKWTKDQIEYYINERNNNLTNNQTKMINSLLQRKPRRIILDRLVYEDSNNNTVFTNNSDIIEEQCIQHYQNIGQSNNDTIYDSLDDLPEEWKDVYNPDNNNINSSFWSCLEQSITIDNIINVLPTLSKKKAPGPSKITNEDLIHLDRYALVILKDFLIYV
ncbi:hypothetical protein RhiirC2_798029 [Rhizophagus irregularis]|uniref:DNase I-like protein n=1 Tax=Rhizophagus irregularis TaxID=588596 RepID=A0A2N1M734_9GLOM|nr:hypothetical protein RhiirC2_798029 [Rhizophagus irregularis]